MTPIDFDTLTPPTPAEAEQFLAEQAWMRQVEWDAKHKIPRGDLFA